jgi:hypothetical protein
MRVSSKHDPPTVKEPNPSRNGTETLGETDPKQPLLMINFE